MAQNYAGRKRSHASRKSAEPRVPAWVWLFTGCVLGAFVMFLMRLSEMQPAPAAKPEKPAARAKAEEKKPAQPRFDFYDLLKENKVVVPDTNPDAPTGSASNAQPAEPQEYILQVASFKNAQDAEQLKVELILLNMEATIEEARIRNGETWHRVLVGPFTSRAQLAKARSTLVENRYEALVLKRTPSSAAN